MKKRTTNFFTISTPSQMMNAMEFIHHFSVQGEKNIVIITCNSDNFINQIKEIGSSFTLVFYVIFSPQLTLVKPQLFNVMPLKLIRLYVSKKRIVKILRGMPVDRLILGNYSNFISQYCTQKISSEMYVLDDGTGSILVAKKRIGEIKEGIPIFDYNFKKKALWLVKLLMGFYNYKIPSKFTFFSSYLLDVIAEDKYICNKYDYLKSLYRNQNIDSKLIYFIGSPISETGYITEEMEIELILNCTSRFKDSKSLYIPHRLDSKSKINKLKTSIDVLSFNLPIEFALTQNNSLPEKIGGFFTSALPNLVEIMNTQVSFFALKIPNRFFLTKNMEKRAYEVYNTFSTLDRIEIIKN